MIKFISISLILCAGVCLAQQALLWECHYCHQQYIGKNPPRFVKCPATDNKQNHWWLIQK